MNTRILVLTSLFTLVVAVLAVLSFTSGHVIAFGEVNEKPSPMVGLARSQTARINVVFVGNPNIAPPRQCKGQIAFFDSEGASLAVSDWALHEGKATFADLPFASLSRAENRVPIRAVVSIGNPNIKKCTNVVRVSLEIFDDDTGATQVYVGGFDPQPDPPKN